MTDISKLDRLQKTIAWAKALRADTNQSTSAWQLADRVVELAEDAIEIEHLRLQQLDRFFNTTELGRPN